MVYTKIEPVNTHGIVLDRKNRYPIYLQVYDQLREKIVSGELGENVALADERELSEALKRRCLYLFIGYPTLEQELAVVRLKVPDLNPRLAEQAVELVQRLRDLDLRKSPSISETLDWAASLVALNAQQLDAPTLENTMSVLLKHETDLQKVRRRIDITSRGISVDKDDLSQYRWRD